jgi:NDP-sugar pyrophosphorylase family protein
MALVEQIKTAELYDCQVSYLKPLFEKHLYPWQMLPELKSYIRQLIKDGLEGFTQIAPEVLVGENVKIAPTATIDGPAIIGANTEIRPGAYIRGSVITGPDCVIGNSSELKNCVLLHKVQVPHYNYVGDSVLGNFAHMGAGSICSNLKSDGKNVIVRGTENYETGLRKLGGIIGDHGDIGCGCVLNPGTVIGQNTSVYPLTSLRGIYPANCIVKATKEIVERK